MSSRPLVLFLVNCCVALSLWTRTFDDVTASSVLVLPSSDAVPFAQCVSRRYVLCRVASGSARAALAASRAVTRGLGGERDCLDTNALERGTLTTGSLAIDLQKSTRSSPSSSSFSSSYPASSFSSFSSFVAAEDDPDEDLEHAAYLASAPVSGPMILLSQMVDFLGTTDEINEDSADAKTKENSESPEISPGIHRHTPSAAIGHSQGAAAAIAAASGDILPATTR